MIPLPLFPHKNNNLRRISCSGAKALAKALSLPGDKSLMSTAATVSSSASEKGGGGRCKLRRLVLSLNLVR